MAEFGYNEIQTVQPGEAAILDDVRPCTRRPRLVIHDNMTPNIILRGIVNNPCSANAQYNVTYSGNIALAEGATVGEVQLALSVNGYTRPLTIGAATPAAVGDYWHVSGDTTLDVPAGCCTTVTVVNASESTGAATAAPAIDIRNLNVRVTRTA